MNVLALLLIVGGPAYHFTALRIFSGPVPTDPETVRVAEAVTVMSLTEMIVLSDSDFGIEGDETQIHPITFDEPVQRQAPLPSGCSCGTPARDNCW